MPSKVARSQLTLMVLSGLGALCIVGCQSNRGQDSAKPEKKAEIGLAKVELPDQPSVVDPLVALSKESPKANGGPSVSKDGHLVPTHARPARALLNLHAVTAYDEVWVYAEPNFHAEKLGFMRRGVRLKVTREQGNKGCKKGWFQLPEGGFACASKGLIVHQQAPYLNEPAEAPLTDVSSLQWARVVSPKTPMWWRLPTKQEWESAQFMRRDWGYKMVPYNGEKGSEPAAKPAKPTGVVLSAQGPGVDLPLSPAMPWLESGSFISLGKPRVHAGHRFWKTAQGGFVQDDALSDFQTQDFRGQKLRSLADFEAAAFVGELPLISKRRTPTGQWTRGDKIPARAPLRVLEVQEFNKRSWSRISTDLWVPSASLVRPRKATRPGGVEANERWIDVDLLTHCLVAYEGDRPVYFTMVASGRPNSESDDFETPTGVWRIYSKEKTSDMVEGSSKDDASFFQDVPWVMYFSGHLALRGSFWHQDFGQARSAGSIDLGPSDARWLFSWTRPLVPLNWHGVLQSRFNPGTAVAIRGQAPAKDRAGR